MDKLGKVKCVGKDWYVYNGELGKWEREEGDRFSSCGMFVSVIHLEDRKLEKSR